MSMNEQGKTMKLDQQPIVVKIGGHDIADDAFLTELAIIIRDLAMPVIIVHGGGAEISELQALMGITPQYVDGVRVTDAASLKVVEMVLCGVVNTRLVRYMVSAGVDALGMSGVDRGLVQAAQMPHDQRDMGFTGSVHTVRGELLRELLAQGIIPVIAPLSLGMDAPVTYNVNADHVAGAVGVAVNAARVVFITNVEGVMVNGMLQPMLDVAHAHALIANGTISGGMIPKVRTALAALNGGVSRAVITNLHGLQSGGGTVFTHESMNSASTSTILNYSERR
jgi:acetylglutamate kinase